MTYYTQLKKPTNTKLIPLVLAVYFLVITLITVRLDLMDLQADPDPQDPRGPRIRKSLSQGPNHSSSRRHHSLAKAQLLKNLQKRLGVLTAKSFRHERLSSEVQLLKPVPVVQPNLDLEIQKDESFLKVGDQTYVYSVFLDDRKAEIFLRVMTLQFSQHLPLKVMYCHFSQDLGAQRQRSTRYELCENHDMKYGGYIYSCPVSPELDITKLKSVGLSFHESTKVRTFPVRPVRPPEIKIPYVDTYPQKSPMPSSDKVEKEMFHNLSARAKIPKENTEAVLNKDSISPQDLTFAICVAPLFGNIPVQRLVEFVELSRLLGAEYFIFYNHSASKPVSDALRYYQGKKLASVLPWTLPPEIDEVWNYGQLSANNDCLYRTMPLFDLVAFNDLDEFIVPHTQASTWRDAFSSLMTMDRCGLVFRSVFFDPGYEDSFSTELQTPVHTKRTKYHSQVRTKVMLSPWRVFEVGIHHISKQNREDWLPWHVEPEIAYLHHYRQCLPDFQMNCAEWANDSTIATRYLHRLSASYREALRDILPHEVV